MLDRTLKKHLQNMEGDSDIKYMKGVTPATLFRFLNGSVYLDNIRKPVNNSVLIEFEDLNNCELLLPFFADMRYRGSGLKTETFKISLLGNYLKIYYPMHLKANMYHDEFITKQIAMVEKCITSRSSDEFIVGSESEKASCSYSFFPTVNGFHSNNTGQCKKVMSDLKGKGMDSFYGINHEMIDALMDCIRTGLKHVMSLYDVISGPEPVLKYALALYKECQTDAKTFADNFDSANYNETRRILEKKIAFDTVFVYLLLSELLAILPEHHMLCRKGRLTAERPTIFYLSSRFSMRSDAVLNLQKKIIIKCILFSTLNRLKKDISKEYNIMDLHNDVGRHFSWLDTNKERRTIRVQSILNRETDCLYLTDELFRARNPVP